MLRSLLSALVVLTLAASVNAQPTFKLDAKRDLKPKATLTVADGKVARSDVADDPGYRLQFHFQKDKKTLATPAARADAAVALPSTEPGTYTVVLELFHPAYKGGTGVKGQFLPISETVTYRIEAQEPLKLTVVPTTKETPPAKDAPKK